MAFLYFTVQNGIQNLNDFSALVVSILDFFFFFFLEKNKKSGSRRQFLFFFFFFFASVPFKTPRFGSLVVFA